MEKGLTLNGWILNPSGRKKLNNVSVTAAVMPFDRTKTELFEHKTDSSGYFGFDLTNEFYDESRLTIRANTKKERLIGTVPGLDLNVLRTGSKVFLSRRNYF